MPSVFHSINPGFSSKLSVIDLGEPPSTLTTASRELLAKKSLSPIAEEKTICLPSSDHAKLPIAVSDLVSCCASPPSGLIRKIWFLSSTRLLRKASHCPSGDQRGLVEDLSPRVS